VAAVATSNRNTWKKHCPGKIMAAVAILPMMNKPLSREDRGCRCNFLRKNGLSILAFDDFCPIAWEMIGAPLKRMFLEKQFFICICPAQLFALFFNASLPMALYVYAMWNNHLSNSLFF